LARRRANPAGVPANAVLPSDPLVPHFVEHAFQCVELIGAQNSVARRRFHLRIGDWRADHSRDVVDGPSHPTRTASSVQRGRPATDSISSKNPADPQTDPAPTSMIPRSTHRHPRPTQLSRSLLDAALGLAGRDLLFQWLGWVCRYGVSDDLSTMSRERFG